MNIEELKKLMEFYEQEYKDVVSREEKMTGFFLDMRVKNLEYLRSFWFNLIILSSAIIVAVFPILLKDPNYFQNLVLSIIGLGLLVIMDIVGCFYLNTLLTKENNNLAEQNDFHSKKMNKEKEMINENMMKKVGCEEWLKVYLNFLKETENEEKEMRKKQEKKCFAKWFDSHFSDLLTSLMIFGIFFIILSFIPIKFCLR